MEQPQSIASSRPPSSFIATSRAKFRKLLHRPGSESNTQPRTFTTGVLAALGSALRNDQTVISADLCNEHIVHCTNDIADLTWGCGYRNIQQLLSSLLLTDPARYESAFGGSTIPSIAEIQGLIETAWQDGYDVEGAEQLKWSLKGGHKWIGTTEVYAFLSSKGYDVSLHQFEGLDHVRKLLDYCKDYFRSDQDSPKDTVQCSNKHPLYFQHRGHSRTIVGHVQTEAGEALLVFDPARRLNDSMRTLTESSEGCEHKYSPAKWHKILKPWLIHELRHKQYQVLAVHNTVLDKEEQLHRKVISVATR